MRVVQKQQLQLGELAIADIDIDLKSRDDIPKIMLGLQYLYTERKEELFEILEKYRQTLISVCQKTPILSLSC